MRGLETSRVLVVDNDINDGVALLKAFARAGIGGIYLTGKVEELPSKKLNSLRLMALDMILEESGGDEKQELSALISIISEVVADNNGPFVIVAWTTRPELIELFNQMFATARPDLKPVCIIKMDKHEMKQEENVREYDVEKILKHVRDEINKLAALNFLLEWEQRIHQAASETTATLYDFSGGVPVEVEPCQTVEGQAKHEVAATAEAGTNRFEKLDVVLRELTLASGGKLVKRGSENPHFALLDALDHLHLDHLERGLDREGSRISKLASEILECRIENDFDTISRINTRILTAQVGEREPLRPGNVYFRNTWPGGKQFFPLDINGIDVSRFSWDTFDPRNDKQIMEWDREGSSENKVYRDARVRELNQKMKDSDFVLIEITPACDYAQGKRKMLKMVVGRIVNLEINNCIGKCDYLMHLGPLTMTGKEDIWYLVLDAHYILGIAESKITGRPVFRLRKHVLDAVQHWLSGHGSRPGFITLVI